MVNAKQDLTKPKGQRFPLWIVVVAVVLCLCIAVVLLWQPILVRFFPGMALTVAAVNSLGQVMDRLRSPLADCVMQASSYVMNGSMDVEISAGGLLSKMSYALRSDSDPANRRQCSSYEVAALGLRTGCSTYLDANCAAFSADLLTGGNYYGVTFDTFAADLEKTGFAQTVSAENLARFHDYVAYLDSIYPSETARQAGLELPDIEAPDWAKTMLAYLGELEFESGQMDLMMGSGTKTVDFITTRMDSRYAASMFLEALKTVSSNVLLASSLYSDSEAEKAPALQEKLEYYRDHTQGAVTFTGYIQNGNLVALDLNWTFAENNGTMPIADRELLAVNLGQDPGQGNWTLTLEQEKAGAITSDTYTVTADGSTCAYGLHLVHMENNVRTETALSTRWDEGSGLLTLDLVKRAGGKEYTAGTSGILERTDGTVRCTVSGLHDFFQLLTLPDFLKDMNLELVSDVTVQAEFTDTPEVLKPDYINLDQWKLPWLLDLFI